MTYSKEGLTGLTPTDLSWLTGIWKGKRGEDIVEEHWSPLGGDTLMAMFRWQKGDTVWFFEFMTIEQHGEHVLLRIKHYYPGLKGWEEKDLSTEFLLVELREREAVFLQVNKPGPWMVYRLEAEDRLVTYFVREGEVTKEEEMFVYRGT